jgi:dihydroneopterin aldolase
VSDAIYLRAMEFEGSHGVGDDERSEPQTIELDVEVRTNLAAAGGSDDLAQTIDYSALFEICRIRAEEHSYHLLEALGEAVASDILDRFPAAQSVVVDVRKPGVPIDGVLDHAGVRIERSRG